MTRSKKILAVCAIAFGLIGALATPAAADRSQDLAPSHQTHAATGVDQPSY